MAGKVWKAQIQKPICFYKPISQGIHDSIEGLSWSISFRLFLVTDYRQ